MNKNYCVTKTIFLCFALGLWLLFSSGCSKDESDDNTADITGSASYSGDITVTIDSLHYTESIELSLVHGSTVSGSFFQFSDGVSGTFTGNKDGNTYTINGNFSGLSRSAFSGKITISSDSEVGIQLQGENSLGNFSLSGTLAKIGYINLAGKYLAHEKMTITIEMNGETETETTEGTSHINMDQQDGQISYLVPGTESLRTGTISSNILQFAGDFVIPAQGVVLTKNTFSAEVTVADNYKYSFIGTGLAEGSYNGQPFKVTGKTEGTFIKQFDIAVGIFSGGSIQQTALPELINIQKQIVSVYPTEVIVKCFPAMNQYNEAIKWLTYIETDLQCNNIGTLLVGHSIGANTIRVGNFTDFSLLSRISIEPLNPDYLNQGANWAPDQREYTWNPTHSQGNFYNYLADANETPYPNGLLGHHIHSSIETVLPNTNHVTIVDKVYQDNIVFSAVEEYLTKSKKFTSQGMATTNVQGIHDNSLGVLTLAQGKRIK